ncbi:MAG TPA: HAD family phosphatase [Caulobacteraceae bacterium]|jgi:HAD superfamily hydrolase (TIGR01509 family)
MVFPRPIRAVVFDMDGLLVDTEALIRDLTVELAEARGAAFPPEVFQQMVGLPNAASDAVARAHFGPEFPLEALWADVNVRLHAACEVGVALKAGVVELLDHLDAAGIPRAIATSSSHASVKRTLGPSGILPRFDAVVAAGDYPRGKPNPDPFLTAAERLGAGPALCLALEDSHNGVRAAHAAGMMTVMVPDLLEPTDEMREKCLAIAESLHHVRDWIEAHRAATL